MQFRYASLGLEFGGGMAGFTLLGWWLDSAFQTGSFWLVTCAIVGSVGGIYHLIRRAYEINRDFERAARRPPEPADDETNERPRP